MTTYRLPDSPHPEYNEDGKRNTHPGYMLKTCMVCGQKFEVAKLLPSILEMITTCGRKSCEEEK